MTHYSGIRQKGSFIDLIRTEYCEDYGTVSETISRRVAGLFHSLHYLAQANRPGHR